MDSSPDLGLPLPRVARLDEKDVGVWIAVVFSAWPNAYGALEPQSRTSACVIYPRFLMKRIVVRSLDFPAFQTADVSEIAMALQICC